MSNNTTTSMQPFEPKESAALLHIGNVMVYEGMLSTAGVNADRYVENCDINAKKLVEVIRSINNVWCATLQFPENYLTTPIKVVAESTKLSETPVKRVAVVSSPLGDARFVLRVLSNYADASRVQAPTNGVPVNGGAIYEQDSVQYLVLGFQNTTVATVSVDDCIKGIQAQKAAADRQETFLLNVASEFGAASLIYCVRSIGPRELTNIVHLAKDRSLIVVNNMRHVTPLAVTRQMSRVKDVMRNAGCTVSNDIVHANFIIGFRCYLEKPQNVIYHLFLVDDARYDHDVLQQDAIPEGDNTRNINVRTAKFFKEQILGDAGCQHDNSSIENVLVKSLTNATLRTSNNCHKDVSFDATPSGNDTSFQCVNAGGDAALQLPVPTERFPHRVHYREKQQKPVAVISIDMPNMKKVTVEGVIRTAAMIKATVNFIPNREAENEDHNHIVEAQDEQPGSHVLTHTLTVNWTQPGAKISEPAATYNEGVFRFTVGPT